MDAVETEHAAESKGERTRMAVLEAAVRLFGERGYDGASLRDIETAAKVNRGIVTYHFGSKANLWKAMFNHTFMPILDDLRSKAGLLRALDGPARARFLIEAFVRTSAERPYMNLLMMQENFTESWRSDWVIESYLVPARDMLGSLGDDPFITKLNTDVHFRYAFLGACNQVFSHPKEVGALFDCGTKNEEFIQAHVEFICGLFKNDIERREN